MGTPGRPPKKRKAKRKSRATGRPRMRNIALARRIKEVGLEVMLANLGLVLPPLPPEEPPRVKLTDEQTRYLEAALVRDMVAEKPVVTAWHEWLKSKAIYHGVYIEVVEKLMAKHLDKLAKATKSYDYQRTQTVANAMGMDRTKVVAKLSQLMEAQKPERKHVYAGPDDKVGYESIIWVPDLKVQTDATKMLLGLFGDKPPAQHVHEIGVTEELAELTDMQIRAKLAELALQAKRLGVGDLVSGPGSVTIEGKIDG